MPKRYHLFFSGNVQGVGFRYTARALADKYGLSGWVMNLADERVEIEIEGKNSEINNFLEGLQAEFKEYIRRVEKEEIPAAKEEKGFYIKF